MFTPGPHPLEECASQLATITVTAPDRLVAELGVDRSSLGRTVRAALEAHPPEAELVLVVDQFEGVFTLGRDPAERTRFIDLLIAAALAENNRCRVVLRVRADFYLPAAERSRIWGLVICRL